MGFRQWWNERKERKRSNDRVLHGLAYIKAMFRQDYDAARVFRDGYIKAGGDPAIFDDLIKKVDGGHGNAT